MSQSARVGTLAIFAAKLVFMASGYALAIGMTRLLSPAEYGVWSVVIGPVSLVNMVLINGTLQTVSRFVAAHPEEAEGVRRRAFLYQAVFSSLVIGVVLLGAGVFSSFLNDPSLAPLFRLAMLITGIYAFYAINVGYLNGKREFLKQALLDIGLSILKLGLILVLIGLGLGIEGAILGFAAAALVVFLASFGLAGLRFRGPAKALSPASFLGFAFSVMGVALLVNALMQGDLLLLKKITPVDIANEQAGFYGAAQQIARIPYYLMVTASLVLFPLVAALKDDDEGRARRADTMSQAFTAILGLVAGMAALTAPIAERVLLVLFEAKYAPAAPALAWLIVALCLLAVVNVSLNMVSGAGRPLVSVAILVGMLALQLGAAYVLIPAHGMEGAAWATALSSGVGLIASAAYMTWRFGMRIKRRVVVVLPVAIAAIAGLAMLFGRFGPEGRIATLLFCAAGYGLYLGFLLVGGVLLGAKAREDRVLLVTKPLAPPYNDGAKVFARAIAEHLAPDRIAVLTSRAGKRALEEELGRRGVEVIGVYPSSGTFSKRGMQNAVVLAYLFATRFSFRALHFFFAPNRATCCALRWLRRLSPGVPFIQTVLSRPRRYEDGKALLFGDVVTAGSEHTARQFQEATGKEVLVVRPGIGPLAACEPRDAALERRGLPKGGFHVLFAGDIDEGGALSHLEKIAPALLLREPRLHFHFSVRAKHPGTVERARAFYDAHLASFGERAHLYVDHDPFSELLDLMDAMVLPQDHLIAKVDAPLVVLEAMARGRPAFLLERPPLDEIPPPDLRRHLLSRDDEEMVEQVLAHARDPGRIRAEALSARVAERFDASESARAFEEIHARL